MNYNDQIQKIIVINKPINEMHDSNGFIVIGIRDLFYSLRMLVACLDSMFTIS